MIGITCARACTRDLVSVNLDPAVASGQKVHCIYERSTLAALLQDYVYRFAPLVLEECGALMLRGNEEGIQSEPFQAVCASHKMVSPGCINMHCATL